jgi:hypothetical protein
MRARADPHSPAPQKRPRRRRPGGRWHQAPAPAQRRNHARLARTDALEQPPQSAEAVPRNRKNRLYIRPSIAIFQSQLVMVMVAKNPRSLGQSIALLRPAALCSGSQNTENP